MYALSILIALSRTDHQLIQSLGPQPCEGNVNCIQNPKSRGTSIRKVQTLTSFARFHYKRSSHLHYTHIEPSPTISPWRKTSSPQPSSATSAPAWSAPSSWHRTFVSIYSLRPFTFCIADYSSDSSRKAALTAKNSCISKAAWTPSSTAHPKSSKVWSLWQIRVRAG